MPVAEAERPIMAIRMGVAMFGEKERRWAFLGRKMETQTLGGNFKKEIVVRREMDSVETVLGYYQSLHQAKERNVSKSGS